MALRLNGSSSGYVELEVPAAAGSHTLTLPDGGGSSGQYLQTNGSGTLSWQTVTDTNTFGFTSLGETTTTSGSGHTVTGIPSTADEIVILISDISVNSTSTPHLSMNFGDGSLDTGSNYRWDIVAGGSSNQSLGSQTSIRLMHTDYTGAGNVYSGVIRINIGTSNIQGTSHIQYHGGQIVFGVFKYTGGAAMDRVQISSASTFDAGKFEVLHNG